MSFLQGCPAYIVLFYCYYGQGACFPRDEILGGSILEISLWTEVRYILPSFSSKETGAETPRVMWIINNLLGLPLQIFKARNIGDNLS